MVIVNSELKKIVLMLVCLMVGIGCRAQIIIADVMGGDSLTHLSTRVYDKDVPDSKLFIHLGQMRRGHACIDWTLRGDVSIPDSIKHFNGKCFPVAVVAFHAFYRCVRLTEVTLSSTVKTIGYEAFYGCAALERIHLSGNLLMLEERTFCGCSSLREVTLSCRVPPHGPTNAFDASTYAQCTLVVPRGCVSVYRNAEPWSRFARIVEAEDEGVVPSDLDYTKWEEVMNYLNGYLKDEQWRIPQRVESDMAWTTTIITNKGPHEMTFSTRKEFGMAVVGDDLSGESCINRNFDGTVTLPDSVSAPDGQRYTVGGVASGAFSECSQLAGITFPAHLPFIDRFAFYDCSSLRKVVFPETMKEIMSSVFAGCSSLRMVEVRAMAPPDLFVDAFDDRVFETATLVIPEGATEAYMATDAWPLFKYRRERCE